MIERVCSIKVILQDWDVFLADAHDPELIVDGVDCVGTTWCGHLRIFINKELQGARLHRTVVHEVTHAVIYSTQCEILQKYNEEQLCEFMAIYAELILKISSEIITAIKKNKGE